MYKFVSLLILLFILSCKEEVSCECVVYDNNGNPSSFSKSTYNAKIKKAEKWCEESPSGFSSNGGYYMECDLKID